MICRSCYAPVRDLKWSSHTQELCSERRRELLRHEHAEICRNHPRAQAPALLLGRICPLCSPDILVKTVEADQLRALGLNNVGMRIDTNAIYRVNENSQVCNFLDAENCPDVGCPCKRQKKNTMLSHENFGPITTEMPSMPLTTVSHLNPMVQRSH